MSDQGVEQRRAIRRALVSVYDKTGLEELAVGVVDLVAMKALIEGGVACRATIIIDPSGVVQHASYNADLLGRSVSETLRLVQALQTGERCPVEWKPGQKTLGKPA